MDEEPLALDSYCYYTVGWLAPLPIERAAAEALLDKQHEEPRDFQQPKNDPLSYSFGRIGKHNIVIASLEAGFYGNVSAATTATSMLSSFPEIRFGLLVGIGGGIPRPESYDLRLGDIVVGLPTGSSGGVIQYDLVKAKAGNQKERKDVLSPPPPVLLQALAKLQAQHERKGPRVPEILQEMEKGNPLMFKRRPNNPGYGYQDDENDRLFKSSYKHVQGKDCQDCSREEEVEREAREDGNDPVIHYGVIASGNSLVKDSVAREDLLKHIPENCICYEMEAAGLMNNFPCLVIRGICDYSDSHKNDRWQRYAAATAASFAKELLGFVRPELVRETQKASQIIHSIFNDVKEIRAISHDSKVMISEQQIMKWLDPPDPSRNYQNAKSKRQKDTCHWFLDSNTFKSWTDKPRSFLWIHGIAGSGKTVLSSAIIQKIRDTCSEQNHAVLYFYFDFDDQDKQTCDHMLRAFLAQMYRSSEKARDEFGSFHESVNGEQPSTDNLYDCFTSMTNYFKDIKVVLDALDEVKEAKSRRELLSMLTKLVQIESGQISCIAMSRNEPEISTAFRDVGSTMEIDSRSVSSDIRQYVRTMISGEGFKRWHQNHRILEEVESYLTSKSNGMFRWVFCQMEVLQECLDESSLRRALTKLPATLDETYNRALCRIPESQKQSALRLLQFLAFSERSINVGEALDVVAVDLSGPPKFHPDDRMPVPEDILRLCPTMLTIEREYPNGKLNISDRLHFPHMTVKEYLLEPTKMNEKFREAFQELHARANMFEISLSYIVSIASLNKASDFPFTNMAVLDLMVHVRKSDGMQIVAEKLLHFLRTQKAFRFWLYCYCKKLRLYPVAANESHGFESLPSPLFIAAYFGLENLVHQLKDEGLTTPTELRSGEAISFWLYRNHDSKLCRSTSLYAATMGSQNTVFRMLLTDFRCLNNTCGPMGTVLDVACHQRQMDTVKLILDEATKNHCELNLRKAFTKAFRNADSDIMQLLLYYRIQTRPTEPSAICVPFAYLGDVSNQSRLGPYRTSQIWPDRMHLPLMAIFHRLPEANTAFVKPELRPSDDSFNDDRRASIRAIHPNNPDAAISIKPRRTFRSRLSGTTYTLWMEQIHKQFAVFWDEKYKRAWLVNGTTALLHLALSAWRAEENGPSKHKLVAKTEALQEAKERNTTDSAMEILTNEHNRRLHIYTNENQQDGSKTPFCFQDLVAQMFDVFSQLNERQNKRHAFTPLIRWKFRDQMAHPFYDVVINRDCKLAVALLRPRGLGWVGLANAIGAVIFLGQGFGDMIKPASVDECCNHLGQLPTDSYYLGVCASDIVRTVRRRGFHQAEKVNPQTWATDSGKVNVEADRITLASSSATAPISTASASSQCFNERRGILEAPRGLQELDQRAGIWSRFKRRCAKHFLKPFRKG